LEYIVPFFEESVLESNGILACCPVVCDADALEAELSTTVVDFLTLEALSLLWIQDRFRGAANKTETILLASSIWSHISGCPRTEVPATWLLTTCFGFERFCVLSCVRNVEVLS